ncbi:MAG: HAD family hydrolase [Bacteroidales bacterium]|jgi:putative hydrolase of the HAD superfamily|nr:HAD family hydrolase [Bacteroidales bacterium]
MKEKIKTIAFDADDTLWVNEPFFREAGKKLCTMLSDYMPVEQVQEELDKTIVEDLEWYGYGVKAFVLSMIDTAIRISNNTLPATRVQDILNIGRDMLQKPIELLPHVEETLERLNGNYRLVVATKGDLLDQERKLKKSGLEKYFHHIEIMSDKTLAEYTKLLHHLDCHADNFLMIGNSMRSDIVPVLELGAYAAHIPYHMTWAHEQLPYTPEHERFLELECISDILEHLL